MPTPQSGEGRADDERQFFRRRLLEERAALERVKDPAEAQRHQRLVARYQTVLSLYGRN